MGFMSAGFEIVWAADKEPYTCDTYYFNLGKRIHCLDIRNVRSASIPDAGVLICGPPCQGFSNAGKRDPTDDRNYLYLEVTKIVKNKKPAFVVIENVKGLQSFQKGAVLEKLLSSLRFDGYKVEWKILNAKDFGIAQNRERLFIVANNKGIEDFIGRIEKHKTNTIGILRNTIGDIEKLDILLNHSYDNKSNPRNDLVISRISQGQKLCDTRLGSRSVHTWQIPEVFGRTTNLERKILFAIAKHRRRKCYRKKESWSDASPLTMKEIASMVGKEFSESLLNRLIKKGYLVEKRPGLYDLKYTFNGKFRRLDYNRPSEAVLTNFGSARNYIHPTHNRPLTVRECARIQAFPDSFILKGSMHNQYRQIGNAVPPPLAHVVAQEIRLVLGEGLSERHKLTQKQFTPYVINEIIRRLEKYGTPNLGNLSNPLDELIYLYISQRTFEKSYKSVFRKLKRMYPSFDKIGCADVNNITKILGPSGLAKQKAKTILGALSKINEDFGETSLRKLRKLDETSRLNYLLSLPRVGLKTAYCIMMFCFNSNVLPIDTNIRRVCQRLGLLPQRIDSKKEHNILHTLIPPKDRYSFHVNCISHARECCIPLYPRCTKCHLEEFCPRFGVNEKPKTWDYRNDRARTA